MDGSLGGSDPVLFRLVRFLREMFKRPYRGAVVDASGLVRKIDLPFTFASSLPPCVAGVSPSCHSRNASDVL